MKNIAVAILSLSLIACSSEEEAPKLGKYDAKGVEAKGDILVDATIGEASNLIPWVASDKPSHDVIANIYDSLIKYDKDLNLVPQLAESWEISEDNLSITFKIRKGVEWSDGTPFSVADVMASYQTIIAPTTITPYAGDYQMVQKAEIVNGKDFKVTYAEPFSPALASWSALAILPKHLLDKEKDLSKSELKTKPMGTGSYILKNWQRGQEVILEANPTHFEHEPWISKTRTRLITDLDAQFLELKAGKIDMMGLKPLQYTRLTNGKEFTDRYAKYNYLGSGYTYMGFKLTHPLFEDKLVRQALSFATPREDIVAGVLLGQGLPIACPFKPGTWAYNEQLSPYPYNLEKAKTLLTQAGWVDTDGDGIIDKDGRAFSFTVMTNQGNDQRIKTAEIMQQAFKQVGIEMAIQTQEWSTFIENTINKRQFEAFILSWSLSVEPDPYDIWHSSKTGEREFNIIGFDNKEADDMMVKARRTFDQVERKQYLDRFQEILHDEQPYLFLYAPYALVALHKRFKNVAPAPAGIAYNFIDWYAPAEQQLYKAAMTK